MAYAAAAAAAAIAQATKASGAIVNMAPEDFVIIVNRCEKPLVVISRGGLIDKHFRYMVSYRGLIFHTKSKTELMLPGKAETVSAKSIWIPE